MAMGFVGKRKSGWVKSWTSFGQSRMEDAKRERQARASWGESWARGVGDVGFEGEGEAVR